MGKRFKIALKNIADYAKSDNKTLRQLLLSVISLTMAVVVIVTMSFSWFSVKSSSLIAENFVLDCGKGLRVNDSGTSELSFSQVNKYLIPASSVDGRNLFFPTDGSDFSSSTESMTFRSANVGDKNSNYIQIDFTLTAQQNHTALYINTDKTGIRVAPTLAQGQTRRDEDWSIAQASALRSALWSSTAEEGVPNTPIVFNPTASTLNTAAVKDVDRTTGAFISSGRQVAHSFSEYSFGGTPVATLAKGVETHFSYIIWLEGTDPKCTDKILNKDIEITLSFSTSWDRTQTIRFQDDTSSFSFEGVNYNQYWVTDLINNHDYRLSLHFEDPDDSTDVCDFNMYKYYEEAHVWTCNIPGDMRNKISFELRSSDTSKPVYKFTYDSKDPNHTATTYNRGSNRLYVAESGPLNSHYDWCQGYWVAIGDSDGAGHDSGGSFDGDDF